METREVTVLLVDDDEVDAEAVRRAFRRAAILNRIEVATDGVAALERLRGTDGREQLRPPLIILLDINMPRMDGFEFLDELRSDERLKRTIVFFLTTSDDQHDVARAYEQHAAGYIVKQRAGEDFLRLIGLIDHYWRAVELPLES